MKQDPLVDENIELKKEIEKLKEELYRVQNELTDLRDNTVYNRQFNLWSP